MAEYPDRTIHGDRISQLISTKIDPGEILREYQKSKHPERFYNLKIGLAWADAQSVLTVSSVLALCGSEPIAEKSEEPCTMGVDTGRQLHVVISRWDGKMRRVVYLGVLEDFSHLDGLMERFQVSRCVVDALPETHATRAFANRHRCRVWLNYFSELQKGSYRWDEDDCLVHENRTEALDASRRVIRDGQVILPQRSPLVEEFASHLASDAKRLQEDPDSGAQIFRYIRTGVDHFSLAFTYDCIAWSGEPPGGSSGLSRAGWMTDWQVQNAAEDSPLGIMRMIF